MNRITKWIDRIRERYPDALKGVNSEVVNLLQSLNNLRKKVSNIEEFKARSGWHGRTVSLSFKNPEIAEKFQDNLSKGCLVFEDTRIKREE